MSNALPVNVGNTGAEAVAVPQAPPLPDRRAFVRQVASAVESLNEANFAGQGREITFSIDRATRLPVVRVIDVNTNEVLHQWPAPYALQLAAVTNRTGQIQDESLL